MSSLAVVYFRVQKLAWMDIYLFKKWFVTEFVPEEKKHRTTLKLPIKAILVIDNAPTRPQEVICEAKITRPVISLLQHMDQLEKAI